MIQDIMDYEVNQDDWLLQLGDWVHECDPSDSYYSATRSSDFILQYFQSLKQLLAMNAGENYMMEHVQS